MVDKGLTCPVELRAWPIAGADNGSDVEQGTALASCFSVAEQQWECSVRDDGCGVDVNRKQAAKGGRRDIGITPVDGDTDTIDDNREVNILCRGGNA